MTDEWGREISALRSDFRALEKRVSKTEKWCEEDSPEFHRQMQDFVIGFKAVELEREKVAAKRHQENSERLEQIKTRSDLWNLGIAVIGLICAICMLYLAVKSANHASMDPAKLFHSQTPVMASTDSAHIPIL